MLLNITIVTIKIKPNRKRKSKSKQLLNWIRYPKKSIKSQFNFFQTKTDEPSQTQLNYIHCLTKILCFSLFHYIDVSNVRLILIKGKKKKEKKRKYIYCVTNSIKERIFYIHILLRKKEAYILDQKICGNLAWKDWMGSQKDCWKEGRIEAKRFSLSNPKSGSFAPKPKRFSSASLISLSQKHPSTFVVLFHYVYL